MSREQADQVALARDGVDKPDRLPAWYGKKAPPKLPPLAARLLTLHLEKVGGSRRSR